MIARTWRGVVRTEQTDEYVRYLDAIGKPDSLDKPGNHGFAILTRPTGELTIVVTVSLWDSLEAVRGFAGDEVERAVFYPEDDRFLVERDLHVDHWQVADASFIEAVGRLA